MSLFSLFPRIRLNKPRRTAAGLALMLGLAFAGPLVAVTPPAVAGHKEMGALDDSAHQAFLRQVLKDRWVASWIMMAQQFDANMMHQMWIIGSFLDAKQQLETQRMFREMLDRAHKDYHPSDQMCRFGTDTRSLAAAQEKSLTNAQVISTILMNRELLANHTSASGGHMTDKLSRIRQFKKIYCDIHDNNDRLAKMCVLHADRDGEDFTRGAPDERTNRDIDFMRSLNTTYTLDIDFTDAELTNDETDILALGKNLFANDLFTVFPQSLMMQEFNKDDYQDVRSIIALRGVLRNSFGHIVGERARGTGANASAPFIKKIVEEMGVPHDEVDAFLGEDPSYFAQMELLTRKMYQNPTFYAALYTKPANVERTAAAMEAIKLMQDRDRFEAALRREMLLSVLLELKLRTAQEVLENEKQNFAPFSTSPAAATAPPGTATGATPGGPAAPTPAPVTP